MRFPRRESGFHLDAGGLNEDCDQGLRSRQDLAAQTRVPPPSKKKAALPWVRFFEHPPETHQVLCLLNMARDFLQEPRDPQGLSRFDIESTLMRGSSEEWAPTNPDAHVGRAMSKHLCLQSVGPFEVLYFLLGLGLNYACQKRVRGFKNPLIHHDMDEIDPVHGCLTSLAAVPNAQKRGNKTKTCGQSSVTLAEHGPTTKCKAWLLPPDQQLKARAFIPGLVCPVSMREGIPSGLWKMELYNIHMCI